MDSKERHDIVNIISPALTYTQNMLLGFYGDVNEKQQKALKNIETCLKELAHTLHAGARPGAE